MKSTLFPLCLLLQAHVGLAADHRVPGSESELSGLVATDERSVAEIGSPYEVVCHVGSLRVEAVDTPRGRFSQLSIPGFDRTATIGIPALPVAIRLLELPLGATVIAHTDPGDVWRTTLGELGSEHPVIPRQPSRPKSGEPPAFAYEEAAYHAPGIIEEALVTVEDVGMLRDMRLVLLKVAPVSYDPVTGTLEIRPRVRISVSLAGADLPGTYRLKETLASPYFRFLAADALRPGWLDSFDPVITAGPPEYLIIADRMFESSLEPLIEWKRAKGFRVATAYTDSIGRSAEQIRAFVREQYRNPANGSRPPTFLLLVGDHEQIPAFKGRTGEHLTDLYYATMTDGDSLPDILVGRISARDVSELTPQIDKTLQYEKYQFPDPSFLKSAVLVAGWSGFSTEWGWPQVRYATNYYFNMHGGMPGSRAFLSTGSAQNVRTIANQLSRGCSFVTYTGHGSPQRWSDPEFSVGGVDDLRNAGKYPLVVGNCCKSSAFQMDRCLAEAWLRARDRGAVGYIGATDDTNWDEDLWWSVGLYPVVHPNPDGAPPLRESVQGGAYNRAFRDDHRTNASWVVAGNLAVEQSSSSRKSYYWEIYHLMGDPSLMTWFGIPRENSVEHPATAPVDSRSLEVKAPVGATIAITQKGQLVGTGPGSSAGATRIALEGVAAGPAVLVVSGAQLRPYIGTLKITP